MKILRSTREYEEWLGRQLEINENDLKQKHKNMASDPFIFLRATFYRWAQIWANVANQVADAPQVFAIGDLHIENFGTWRDAEGRLVWGINDFDEVYRLPYTNDLLRLATSAKLAAASNHLSIGFNDACQALLDGYIKGLAAGGRPFVLAGDHAELRKMAIGILRDPLHYWKKLDSQTGRTPRRDIPKAALAALAGMMPEAKLNFNVFSRQAGQGSLGRQRFVAIAEYRGGRIAREVKALAASACVFAEGKDAGKTLYQDMLDQAIRCPDPFLAVKGNWVVRRLAPDCSRIDLNTLPQERDERILLTAMGFEVANIHLGSKNAAVAIRADLKKRKQDWLADAARDMAIATEKDWKNWRAKQPDS